MIVVERFGNLERNYCHFFFGGVVVEAEAQSEILSAKFAGQRRKRIRAHDAGPGRAIERNVSRSGDQLHARDLSIFRDRELDDQVSVFHLRGFRNRVVPVLTHVMQHALQVGAEIHALVSLRISRSPTWRPCAPVPNPKSPPSPCLRSRAWPRRLAQPPELQSPQTWNRRTS